METVTATRAPRRRAEPRAYRRPPAWHALAACASADPDSWYPELSEPSKAVLRICTACPVRDLCLDQALADGEQHGIWGGLTPPERRALARTTATTVTTGSERAA
jgi:WhiB family redox-sensing transcriptional regulator